MACFGRRSVVNNNVEDTSSAETTEAEAREQAARYLSRPEDNWRFLRPLCFRWPSLINDLRPELQMPMALDVGRPNVIEDFGITKDVVNIDLGRPYELGTSLLHVASRHGHTAIASKLLAMGARVNARNVFGETPLFLASEFGYDEIVRMLLEHKADVDLPNSCQETPLYAGCYHGHQGVVQVLLDHGADLTAKSDDGQTALLASLARGHIEVAALIRKASAERSAAAGPR